MRSHLAAILMLLLITGKTQASVNGGIPCAACSAIVSLTEQLAIVHNESVVNSLDRLCSYLPKGLFRLTCDEAVKEFGPTIIAGLYSKETADVICQAINFCHTDPGQPECHIYPKPNNGFGHRAISYQRNRFINHLKQTGVQWSQVKKRVDDSICDNPIFKRLCEYVDRIFKNHEPAEDIDNDGHSTIETLRGSSWKGKDCDDLSPKTHPGAKPLKNDMNEDSNCNGIYGQVPNMTVSYEDLFCNGSQQIGLAVLGDSISAHFHLPEEWFDATQMTEESFDNLIFIIENEIDWPQLSALTGYMNTIWPVVQGPTRSIYENLWNRNKCNFRDYQNIGVNGADTNSVLKTNMYSLSRNQNTDQPLLVFYSLVGNDVCNGDPDTVASMTKPEVYYNNMLKTMEYLDTRLPPGSHVLVTSLANGSLLYEGVGNRVYPLGRLRNDIKYSDMYTYLSCLQISPCNGWMTTNATLRNITSNYAVMLSNIGKNFTQTHTFKNFDIDYTDFPINPVLKKWESMGGELWQLIEPVDGFHMNQIANAMVADEYWNTLLTRHPEWIGKENPNNEAITKIFGNQGGY